MQPPAKTHASKDPRKKRSVRAKTRAREDPCEQGPVPSERSLKNRNGEHWLPRRESSITEAGPASGACARETSGRQSETELTVTGPVAQHGGRVTPRGAATVRGRVSSSSARAARLLLLSCACNAL